MQSREKNEENRPMSGSGYVNVPTAELHAALRRIGITEPKHASRAIADEEDSRFGRSVDKDELRRIRQSINNWLGNQHPITKLQSKSLPLLARLIGDAHLRRLCSGSTFAVVPRLADSLRDLKRLLGAQRSAPESLFNSTHEAHRQEVTALLTSLSRPLFHDESRALQSTIQDYLLIVPELSVLIQPLLRALPLHRLEQGFDFSLLSGLARLVNDIRITIMPHQLPATTRSDFARTIALSRHLFNLLEDQFPDAQLREVTRSQILYELSRHHSLRAQITGESPYNPSRLSIENPLNAGTFDLEMRWAIHYAEQLKGLPPPNAMTPVQHSENWWYLRSLRHRILCYANDPSLRPSRESMESNLCRLNSPENIPSAYVTRMHYFIANGDRKNAARVCDTFREDLLHLSSRSLPELLRPIFAINSHRLGGDASSAEVMEAMDRMSEERFIYLNSGHHLVCHPDNKWIADRTYELRPLR
jgi:hypothetical protein